MPKTKAKSKSEDTEIIKKDGFDSEEKETEKTLDPDLLLDDEGAPVVEDVEEEEVEDEDSELLDDDEVDPFKDKWEE